MPNDPKPSPLEEIEIPEYEPVPDRSLRWLMQASSDPAKAAMSRELAERRLAERQAAPPDHHEAVAQAVAYLQGRGYRVISPAERQELAQDLEAAVDEFAAQAHRARLDSKRERRASSMVARMYKWAKRVREGNDAEA